jgi:molecular chaperone DnaK
MGRTGGLDAGTSGTRTVERIYLTESPDNDMAVLRLTQPVDATPLLLGYPKLVRIGDEIWAPRPSDDSTWTHMTGLVDRFDSANGLRLFVSRLQIPPSCTGAPVLSELGEVVGIITGDSETCVLSADALDPLLTEAGFDR